jgi:hypothetical protein
MQGLGTFLLAMCKPLLGRILVSLGFSVVTLVGLDLAITNLKGQFIAAVGGIPADGLNLALLAGAGQAMGIIMGAITTRILLWKVKQSMSILGANA